METSQQIGQRGEDIATDFLKRKGYQILERNFKRKWGEIDIVAQKGEVVYFCEVKTAQKRQGFFPEDEIDNKKKWQLRKMAQLWLNNNKMPPETPVQIDVIAVELTTKGPEITHFPNAIEDIF